MKKLLKVGRHRGEGRGGAQGGDSSGLRWEATKTSWNGYYISFSNKFSLFSSVFGQQPP